MEWMIPGVLKIIPLVCGPAESLFPEKGIDEIALIPKLNMHFFKVAIFVCY